MEKSFTVSAIVAMAQNHVIGKDNALIWHIPEDLQHFKRLTMGKPMIMGRKCFESLPGILPGRAHIVISRHPVAAKSDAEKQSQVHYADSVPAAIETAKMLAAQDGQNEAFIIGGGEIYRQTLPIIDRLYITHIHRDYEGDTIFPIIDQVDFQLRSQEKHADHDPPFTFKTFIRTSRSAI